MDFKKNNSYKAGFTLVEALIFSLIVVIVVMTFYRTFASGANVLRDARARISAAQVANEVLESLRNVTYDKLVSTEAGPITDWVTVHKSGIDFMVGTNISYVDDEFDFTAESGLDEKPGDYKNILVVVKWMSKGEEKRIAMNSLIAPPGTEELFDGGVLDVKIRRSDDVTPVENVDYEIWKVSTNERLDWGLTSENGLVHLVGYAAGDVDYKIRLSKSGFYPVETVPMPADLSCTPNDVHASVSLNHVNYKTITFDPVASLELETIDPLGNPIGNIDFSLEGGRQITCLGATNVYSFPKSDRQTDGSGTFAFSNESAGSYTFEFKDTPNNAGYEFWKVEPLASTWKNNVFKIAGGGLNEEKAVLIPKSTPSLFLKIAENAAPLSGAEVTVKSDALGYAAKTQISDSFGYVYFPIKEDPAVPMPAGAYNVSVHLEGYQDKELDIDVSNMVHQEILLQAGL